MITKPLLAGKIDKTKPKQSLQDLQFDLWATPKIDGIRCLKIKGEIVSRTFKLIPNNHIRATLAQILPDNIDGELMIRSTDGNFQKVVSGIMSEDGEPNFVFHAFDYVRDSIDKPYLERLEDLKAWYKNTPGAHPHVNLVLPRKMTSLEELAAFEAEVLAEGAEGVMVRKADSKYKCGRSSFKEHILIKIKLLETSEAEVTGFYEANENTNEATKDAFGHTERSSHKAGKVGKDTLGGFHVRDIHTGVEFNVGTGTGLTKDLRQEIWNNQSDYLGKIMMYEFQPIGMDEKPRCPSYKGWRNEIDIIRKEDEESDE